jgi:hypothetical protein
MPFGNLTQAQREAALAKANEARKERATLISRVRAGEVAVKDLLGDEYADNPVVKKLPVRTLLRAVPGVGNAKAEATLIEARVPSGRRVAGLGALQREALLNAIGRWAH